MNGAVFLDRDGTINIDGGYLYRIKDFQFIPGAIEALKELSKADYKMIIITSQSGIGRGYYTDRDFQKLNGHMLKEMGKEGIRIDGVYYCPHAPEKNCICRKPETGMIKKASSEFEIDLKKSFVVGDKTTDIKMGENAGCRTVLVKTGLAGRDGRFEIKPDYTADDLHGAVKWILKQK